ncbi:MAG TPA: DNA-3-methyladenine glycosylase I, partial [Pseudolysinimonas sp.]|nr:DNA-3-methyladenine glycosylase I [Pseudolysinimonas sp.]
PDGKLRCRWSDAAPEFIEYHDGEWGFPVRDDQRLFEKLSLEGFQAGLSWSTILKRRETFRAAFSGFDIAAVAAFGPADVTRLMADPGIIRNAAKVDATISNARITAELVDGHPGAFDELLWGFAPPRRAHRLSSWSELPATTPESTAASAALKKLGFRFVGPTTIYALMQSSGMVDDHIAGCFIAEQADAA